MPLFECLECGCVDNTAVGDYWCRVYHDKKPALCTECVTGKWHNKFPKESAEGYFISEDGFLYSPEEVKKGNYSQFTNLIGVVPIRKSEPHKIGTGCTKEGPNPCDTCNNIRIKESCIYPDKYKEPEHTDEN